VNVPATLTMPGRLRDQLWRHLFPGDGDEHGAVIMVGITASDQGPRLLARDLILARDHIDYVAGRRGYRRLRAEFVQEAVIHCRDWGFGYLAVHNHGGTDAVRFSGDDIASHERGYPALLDILAGSPAGAIVVASNAIAGDIWFSAEDRRELAETRVLGARFERLHASPPPRPRVQDARYDRQARLFGDRGQDLLAGAKVGVIGAGGVGSLVIEQLARLGVGHLVVADTDRIETSNLSRVAGSTKRDAHSWAAEPNRPDWLQRVGRAVAAPKIRIARRNARRANSRCRFEGIPGNIIFAHVALAFSDCDYLFLAADGAQPRLVFNALVHQYLIPGVQMGVKIVADKDTGEILDAFSIVRPVTPDHGCLWCNGLISPARLQQEAATTEERREQNYLNEPDVPAPSVITMNAVAASHATNDFMYAFTGLSQPNASPDYQRFLPRVRSVEDLGTRADQGCMECGTREGSRLATGDARQLPVRLGQ